MKEKIENIPIKTDGIITIGDIPSTNFIENTFLEKKQYEIDQKKLLEELSLLLNQQNNFIELYTQHCSREKETQIQNYKDLKELFYQTSFLIDTVIVIIKKIRINQYLNNLHWYNKITKKQKLKHQEYIKNILSEYLDVDTIKNFVENINKKVDENKK